MDLSPYEQAQLEARRILYALELRDARAITSALIRFAADLDAVASAYARGAEGRAVGARIARAAASRLAEAIERAAARGRRLAFTEILAAWKDATTAIARAEGVEDALMGGIPAPRVGMMGAFESVQGAYTWKTLIARDAERAAAEATAIIRQAIASGMATDELARRLRRYVLGSEPFQQAFGEDGKIDLGRINPVDRGAARLMRQNAERIAYSELGNASHEATIQAYYTDPIIEAALWNLSLNRGRLVPPDACDILAKADLYGLGAGVFPVAKIPPRPHPWDRCYLTPKTRPRSKWGDPKPNPALQSDPGSFVPPGSGSITSNALARAQASASTAVAVGEASSARVMRRLAA